MAYYDPLIAKWATAPAGTTTEKLAWINAQTVTGPAIPMKVASSEIYNRTDRPEYEALQATKQGPLQRNLALPTVDFSPGSSMRALWAATFAAGSKTQTNLAPYVATFDAPKLPWATATVAQGGGGLNGPVSENDLKAAGII